MKYQSSLHEEIQSMNYLRKQRLLDETIDTVLSWTVGIFGIVLSIAFVISVITIK